MTAVSLSRMRKFSLAASVCAISLLGGCSGSSDSQPRQTVTQASDVIGQNGEDDSASNDSRNSNFVLCTSSQSLDSGEA